VDIFEIIFNTGLMQLVVNETKKPFGLRESSMGYIWCFLTFSGHGMEHINQYVNADTNITSEIVMMLVEHLDHGHTLWMDSFFLMIVQCWPDS
jgi:hypothetical protein